MLGERIARVISRVLMNTLGLILILGLVILALGAREPFTVVVTVIALMVPVYVIVELAVALAKIEPPDAGKDKCGRTHALLCIVLAAPALLTVSAVQCRDDGQDAVTVVRCSKPMPRFEAAIARLRSNG